MRPAAVLLAAMMRNELTHCYTALHGNPLTHAHVPCAQKTTFSNWGLMSLQKPRLVRCWALSCIVPPILQQRKAYQDLPGSPPAHALGQCEPALSPIRS